MTPPVTHQSRRPSPSPHRCPSALDVSKQGGIDPAGAARAPGREGDTLGDDEANRVFGFDGWDRETVSNEQVWQDARISPKACSYAVRVRIKGRAGKTIVAREGTGLGHGTGAPLGKAQESALKEAETEATKRGLVTFGNLFGVALYDNAQAGVQRTRALDQELSAAPVSSGRS